jgi:hypothetical protein
MTIYESEKAKYQGLFQQESKKYNLISGIRLALATGAALAAFLYFKNGGPLWLWLALTGAAVFLYLVNRHGRVARQKLFYGQLVRINEQEIAALAGDLSGFDNGARYVEAEHPYTFDLDVFGDYSLFQHVNRTANAIGADTLARYFRSDPGPAEILETQEALRDLAQRLTWRQHYLAAGQLHADPHSVYRRLLAWAALPVAPTSPALRLLYFALPAAAVASLLGGIFYPDSGFWTAFKVLAVINLGLVAAYFKKIKAELEHLDEIYKIVEQYGFLIQYIEKEEFTAAKLVRIRERLRTGGEPASQIILRLSAIIHRLESVQNIFGALVFNALFLYHLHVLLGLERWKRRHAGHIRDWIESTGELEALASLAHFAYNNPDFVFPTISGTVRLEVQEMGHPLIPASQRVCNDIAFGRPGFVILTGSNMSGKSTFLRTVGINLLLAKIGAPVCARTCTFYPFDIFVCMKLSDSLHDNESYFYAELKRLRRIIDRLESGPPGFVLLDEVLRGTNSNDKLTGTLGLVETMVRLNATGLIATHDLNVCELALQHPDYLRNMCFEVEMTADNLVFDYRLREGVCVNKSASFLMKKMGVI